LMPSRVGEQRRKPAEVIRGAHFEADPQRFSFPHEFIFECFQSKARKRRRYPALSPPLKMFLAALVVYCGRA